MSDSTKIGPIRLSPYIRNSKATGQWQIDLPPHIAPHGRRKRLFFATKASAETEAKRLLREYQIEGKVTGFGPKIAGLTFSELSRRWLAEQKTRVQTQKKRSTSLETNAYQLKSLLAFFGAIDIERIREEKISEYQAQRIKQGRKAPTINSEVGTLVQILRWGHKKRLMERLPQPERIPAPRARVTIPTPDEVAAIIAALPQSIRILIRFLAETGCRKSEALHLEWSDIDFERCVVSIRRKEGFTPKTHHSDRDVFIGRSLADALRAKKLQPVAKLGLPKVSASSGNQGKLVFPGRFGSVRTNITKALASAVKKAGVQRNDVPLKLTFHLFRKAHASWQAMRNIPREALQARLGHAPGSRVTNAVYVYASEEALKNAVLELPVIDSPSVEEPSLAPPARHRERPKLKKAEGKCASPSKEFRPNE